MPLPGPPADQQPAAGPRPRDPEGAAVPPSPRAEPAPRLGEDEARAAVAVRRELGPDYEDEVARGLAERVEELVTARSAERGRAAESGSAAQQSEDTARAQRLTLGIVSVVMAVPITAISAVQVDPGLLGVGASWAGLVGVNAVFALSSRRRGEDRRPR